MIYKTKKIDNYYQIYSELKNKYQNIRFVY